MIAWLGTAAGEFADLHNVDRSLPHRERGPGTIRMLAIRPWEPQVFRTLRRDRQEDVAVPAAPRVTHVRASRQEASSGSEPRASG